MPRNSTAIRAGLGSNCQASFYHVGQSDFNWLVAGDLRNYKWKLQIRKKDAEKLLWNWTHQNGEESCKKCHVSLQQYCHFHIYNIQWWQFQVFQPFTSCRSFGPQQGENPGESHPILRRKSKSGLLHQSQSLKHSSPYMDIYRYNYCKIIIDYW